MITFEIICIGIKLLDFDNGGMKNFSENAAMNGKKKALADFRIFSFFNETPAHILSESGSTTSTESHAVKSIRHDRCRQNAKLVIDF